MAFPKYLRNCRVTLQFDPNTKTLPYCWLVFVGGNWYTLHYASDAEYRHAPWNKNIRESLKYGLHERTLTSLGWKKLKDFKVV